MHGLVWFIGITALCSACTDRKHMLAELADVDVRVSAAHPIDEQSGPNAPAHVIVDLDYDVDHFRQTHDSDCAVLDDIAGPYATVDDVHSTSATFDGVYMTLTDPGGADDSGNCRPPRFELDWTLAFRELELFVGDDRALIGATFHGAVLSPRHATLLSHDTWTFAAGDVVTLAWSHAQDASEDFEVWLEGPAMERGDEGWQAGTEPMLLATVRAVDTEETPGAVMELSIPIPSPPPVSGEMVVHIMGASYTHSGAASCRGAARCLWNMPDGYRHQISIE